MSKRILYDKVLEKDLAKLSIIKRATEVALDIPLYNLTFQIL